MNKPAVIAPAARREIAEAVRWIASDNPDAAIRLRDAVLRSARLIGNRPTIGRRQPALVGENYRLWSISGFPYVLVYDPAAIPPRILRVLHTSRALPGLLAGTGGG